jgi:hypothetical protein
MNNLSLLIQVNTGVGVGFTIAAPMGRPRYSRLLADPRASKA